MNAHPLPSRAGSTEFRWGEHTYVMGIVNMTPDSFSGDGLAGNEAQAAEQALGFSQAGAHLIDVGGESTRPGHTPVDDTEELNRVVPAVRRIASEVNLPVSIDTTKPAVAAAALDAGATIINDVSGLRSNVELAKLAAQSGAMLILMHGHRPEGPDLVRAIIEDLRWSVQTALDAGVPAHQIMVDPGFGFGKGPTENLLLLRRLAELRELGYPILVGTSRKSMIGHVLGTPPDQRLEGTAATVAIAIANGADMVRVHDVSFMARVTRMSDAIVRGTW